MHEGKHTYLTVDCGGKHALCMHECMHSSKHECKEASMQTYSYMPACLFSRAARESVLDITTSYPS